MLSKRNYAAAAPAESQRSDEVITDGERECREKKQRPGYSLFQPLSNEYLASKQNSLRNDISSVFDKSLSKIDALIKPRDMTYGFFTEMELQDNVIKMRLPANAVSGWNLIEKSFIAVWNKLIPNFIIRVEKPAGNPLQLKKHILLHTNSELFSSLAPEDIEERAEKAGLILSNIYHTDIKITEFTAFFQKFELSNVKNSLSREMDEWDPALQPGTDISKEKLSEEEIKYDQELKEKIRRNN